MIPCGRHAAVQPVLHTFNPFSTLFSVNSQHTDLLDSNWAKLEDLNLWEMLCYDRMRLVRRESVLRLPTLAAVKAGLLLNQNVVGKLIEIKIRRRWAFAEVMSYSENPKNTKSRSSVAETKPWI